MSTDHLFFRWWIEDGVAWVEHECSEGAESWRVPSCTWAVTDEGALTPSFDCVKCGRHVTLSPADRVPPPTPEKP
jgi:hypothetical protein